MPTRLSIWCNRFIEAGWLAALIIIPLYFNPSTSRIFEADKAALLRSMAVLMGLAWAIKACEAWFAGRKKTPPPNDASSHPSPLASLWKHMHHPIILAAVLLVLSYTLSTVVSILPHLSLWGQYDRLQGLYTVAAYLVFFFSIAALLRTHEQLQRIITAVLLTSLPIALYGILQHFDLRLWTWTFDSAERVHSTLGNPIFLAAFLGLTLPLTLYRLVETRRTAGSWLPTAPYLVLLVLQLTCIFYTQSRGPVLGLMVATFFGGMLWGLARHRWRMVQAFTGVGLAVALLLIIINLPNTPLSFVQDVPYLNRFARLANAEESTRGRVLIWEGAIDLVTADPKRLIAGYGPETTRYAFYPYHSAAIGNLEGWNVVPDRMHNESYDVVITTGLIGFFIYLLLFSGVLFYGLRWVGLMATARKRNVFLALWFAGAVLAVAAARIAAGTWTYSGVALSLGLLGGSFLYLTGYAFLAARTETPPKPPPLQPFALLIILLLSGIIAHFVEINVGIAVTTTRLYFWIYTAMLVALGLFFPRQRETPRTHHTPEKKSTSKASSARTKRTKKKKRPPKESRPLPDGLVAGSLLAGLILGTMAFSFIVPIDDPRTARLFIGATWILASSLLAAEWYVLKQAQLTLRALAVYAGVAWAPALLLLAFTEAGPPTSLSDLVLYHLLVLAVLIGISLSMRRNEGLQVRPSTPVSIVLSLALTLLALVFVYRTNVRVIQANIYYNVARSALQQQQYDLAATRYREALALDPHQGLYQLELAQALVSKAVYETPTPSARDQRFLDAEAILLDAVAENPYEPYAYAQMAEIYRVWAQMSTDEARQTERREKAAAFLNEALQYNNQNILFLRKWAELQEEQGHTSEAMENYRELLQWDSTNTALYMQLGRQYYADEQWQEAAAMYTGALRHAPQPLPNAHRLLAYTYLQMNRLEEALQESRQAFDLDPDTPANHILLIQAYHRTGQCSQALDQARTSLSRWPDNTNLQTWLTTLTSQCDEA